LSKAQPETVNQFPRKFRIHGILGWHSESQDLERDDSNLSTMTAALNSTLVSSSFLSPRYQHSTTGDSAQLGDYGYVSVIGYPRFSNQRLADTASQHGPATALALAYSESDDNFLEQMWGRFSFSIIDPEHNRMLSGIDRLGQESLYYASFADGLAWGSTANSVLAHSKLDSVVDPQGIYNYSYFHMLPSPTSIFRGLNKLPASTYFKIEDSKFQIVRYWMPKFHASVEPPMYEMGNRLRSILRSSVARAVENEVNVGAFLSGGLDSSTVTGMLTEVSEGSCRAYSIGFAAEGYDEMEYARTTAKHFGASLTEYYVTPQDVVELLPTIATSYEEPFGNSSALPTFFCARMAKQEGESLLLAGDGGDEVFAGNERYAKQGIFESYQRIPSWLRLGLIEPLVQLTPNWMPLTRKSRSFINQANTPLPDRLQAYNFLNRFLSKEVFEDAFLDSIHLSQPLELQRKTYQIPHPATHLNRMLYLDWQYTLADNDLRKVVHMCSVGGIDVSFPMLDDDLVQFSLKIPSNLKISRGRLRHFYKEALKGWLPEKTLAKKKQGFGLPFGIWMANYQPLQEIAFDNITKLKSRGIFNPNFLDKAIELHRNGHAPYFGELIWILTVLELWLGENSE
jgi:asparagine synthase (glutamine-hydrolysing)